MTYRNLDLLAAEAAMEADKQARELGLDKASAEKLWQEAASVLTHQGPTALFLYLRVKGPLAKKLDAGAVERWAERLAHQGYVLLTEIAREWPKFDAGNEEPNAQARKALLENSHERLTQVAKLGTDLTQLLTAKRILEQYLIYIRYYTKTLKEKEK